MDNYKCFIFLAILLWCVISCLSHIFEHFGWCRISVFFRKKGICIVKCLGGKIVDEWKLLSFIILQYISFQNFFLFVLKICLLFWDNFFAFANLLLLIFNKENINKGTLEDDYKTTIKINQSNNASKKLFDQLD